LRLGDITSPKAEAVKIGEWPPYGEAPPNKLSRIIEDDSELIMKGLRCEAQGLGIAASVYYRRVVENQKNALIDAVIKVSQKTGASEEMIENLTNARSEKQFTLAMSMIKEGIPDVLKINGKNPFTLLHDALSDGVHNLSDSECLEIAHDIRLVLYDFSENISAAMKDKVGLHEAVKRLEKRASKK
jgi:hypothetical protein